MPELQIDAALWVVGDPTAAAVVASLAGEEPVVRLDLPGWRVALEALAVDGPVGVAVGRDGDGARVAAALAALGAADAIDLLLCGHGEVPADLVAALAWAGRDAAAPAVAAVDGHPVLHLRLTDGPPAPGGDEGAGPTHVAALLASLASIRPVRRRVGVSWRVGVVGAPAWHRFGGWVVTVPVPRDALGSLGDRVDHLDALVVSTSEGWSDDDLAALVSEAGALDVPVIAVDGGAATWAAGADVRAGADRPHPVDVGVVNPQGWRRLTPEVVAVVPSTDPRDADGALAAVHEQVGGPRVRVVGESSHAHVPTRSAGLLRVLRDVRGVVDHPGFHADPVAHASWLVQLAAAAVPVVCLELPEDVADLLGERLAGAIRGARLGDLADPDERERRTVLTRRAAWLGHSVEARWRALGPQLGLPVPRRRSFSLVLATNRPDFVELALAQVTRQTWDLAELVVALNGDAFGPDVEPRIHAGTHLPTTVLRVPEHEPLGEVLNQACQASSGDVITKWDDDDWYSPDHLVDLALALDHSGAHLVGKAAEFVYLAAPDLTIRRFTTGAETGSRSIAGGTLTFPRDVWRDLGGFARIGVGEDQQIIGDVLDAGGTIHRTHGFGYLLHRHGRHAWSADDQYFIDQADAQRAGRDHEWTLT